MTDCIISLAIVAVKDMQKVLREGMREAHCIWGQGSFLWGRAIESEFWKINSNLFWGREGAFRQRRECVFYRWKGNGPSSQAGITYHGADVQRNITSFSVIKISLDQGNCLAKAIMYSFPFQYTWFNLLNISPGSMMVICYYPIKKCQLSWFVTIQNQSWCSWISIQLSGSF